MNMKLSPEQNALNRAITSRGGIASFARDMELSGPAVVHQWRLTRVPAERCPAIEALTGVLCEELRPDVPWAVLRNPPKTPDNTAQQATETIAGT
jgi:DNA-binding transcriptional regulator YdaS (Cro superfamily)